MNIYLISLLLVFQTSMTRTPNFYPSYIAAKEASKNYQKDLLIFFSKSGCAECDAAWANFEKDQYATKVYISTLVDAADFDGIVLWDKYNFKTVPAWVVLNPDGQLKDKWSGDWKKTPTRPVGETNKAPEAKATAVTATPMTTNATNTTPSSEIKSTPVVQQAAAPAITPAPTAPASAPVVKAQPTSTGYVLQAGYFGSEPNASKLVNDLQVKGYSGYSVKSTVQNGSTFYRVISPAYNTEAEANNQVQALATSGVKATVKKVSEL